LNNVLLVGAGGFLGACARYLLGKYIGSKWNGDFPLGTFLINIIGSFLLGLLVFSPSAASLYTIEISLGAGIGFLGAFTTFSTLEYESLVLLEKGKKTTALLYVISSFVLGCAAAWLCLWI
jgi:CrcB protein